MDIQPISTKDLRQDLPNIKAQLLAGQSFFWIDRSKPVGIIQPLPQRKKALSKKQQLEEYEKYIEKIAGGINSKKQLSPKQLNRFIDERYEKI